jgi:hypothetical protein
MRHLIVCFLMAAGCSASLAAPTPPAVRAEIDALLERLRTSGCEFNRNGSWNDGARAKAHLLRKLGYIERKGTLASTEQFIELAASSSSSSGAPYQVRCGAGQAVPSRQWLSKELSAIRSGAGRKP